MFSLTATYTVPADSPAPSTISVSAFPFLDSSLIVKKNNTLVPKTEYSINALTRVITFDDPLVSGDVYTFRQPNYGYHQVIRRVSAVFGTMFNDILVKVKDESNNEVASIQVPFAYGPAQKYLARIRQRNSLDDDLDGDDGGSSVRMTLPRMSFELTGMAYDTSRQMNRFQKVVPCQSSGTEAPWLWEGVPYILEYQLNIMTKKYDEGLQIVEQIVPYFAPSIIVPVKTVPALEQIDDIAFKLESVSPETNYEGTYDEMEYIQWTLSFAVQCYLYRPTNVSKLINVTDINILNWDPDAGIC